MSIRNFKLSHALLPLLIGCGPCKTDLSPEEWVSDRNATAVDCGVSGLNGGVRQAIEWHPFGLEGPQGDPTVYSTLEEYAFQVGISIMDGDGSSSIEQNPNNWLTDPFVGDFSEALFFAIEQDAPSGEAEEVEEIIDLSLKLEEELPGIPLSWVYMEAKDSIHCFYTSELSDEFIEEEEVPIEGLSQYSTGVLHVTSSNPSPTFFLGEEASHLEFVADVDALYQGQDFWVPEGVLAGRFHLTPQFFESDEKVYLSTTIGKVELVYYTDCRLDESRPFNDYKNDCNEYLSMSTDLGNWGLAN
jgi:hypothetical protein